MEELYYMASIAIPASIADTIIDGDTIKLNELVYKRLSKKPKRRTIERRLLNVEGDQKLLIYK